MNCNICEKVLNKKDLYNLRHDDLIGTCIEHNIHARLGFSNYSCSFINMDDILEMLLQYKQNMILNKKI